MNVSGKRKMYFALFSRKTAQITAFMIIGLIVLATVSLVIYLKQHTTLSDFSPTVPEELMPAKRFVESCLESVSRNGIEIAGIQSGYIDIPGKIANDRRSYINLLDAAKEPYWYYRGRNRVPKRAAIEEDMEDYIETEMEYCLEGFSSLPQYDVEILGDMDSTVIIADEDVIVELSYPIKVSKDGKTEKLTDYRILLPVRFGQIMDTAEAILAGENEDMFLEELTINFMSMDPQIPLTDMVFSCSPLRWFIPDIKERLQTVLSVNLPSVRIDSTDYPGFSGEDDDYDVTFWDYTLDDMTPNDVDAPEDSFEYHNMFWHVAMDSQPDLRVSLRYDPSFGMDMKVRPRNGQMLGSDAGKVGSDLLKFLCINTYHFTYDISYPIDIKIEDRNAFGGAGYSFHYAIPVTINHNQGDRSAFGLSQFLGDEYDPAFCSDTKQVRNQEEAYQIAFIDAVTKLPIDEPVTVEYHCIKYRCPLGDTAPLDGLVQIKTGLPSGCANGFLTAESPDYLKKIVQLGDGTTFSEIPLYPLKTMDFDVVLNEVGLTPYYVDSDQVLEDDFRAAISIYDEAKDFEAFMYYPIPDNAPEEMKKLKLILGDNSYSVDIILYNEEGKILGGYQNSELTITQDEVEVNDVVTFHVLRMIPEPADSTQMYELLTFMEEDETVKNDLRPVFGP